MTPVEVVLAAAAAVASGVLWWSATAFGRRAFTASTAVVAAAAAAGAVLDRVRWPLLPIGCGLAGASVVASVGRRWPAVLRFLVRAATSGLIGGGVVALWAFPRMALPEPSGPAELGTTVVQWRDPERRDRPIVAQLWYPASPTAKEPRSWYLGRDRAESEVVADALGATYGVPSFLFHEAAVARTNARWRAAPAPSGSEGARWPVVLFSPGLGGFRTQSTGFAEELASHGFVVVALDHPGDSAVVVLDDGSAIRTTVHSTGDAAEDERNADGWAMARADDLRFVRSRLEAGTGLRPSGLVDRLDLDRVAVAGHSIGGAAALRAAIDDHRFGAAIDIDGFPRNVDGTPYPQPALGLVGGRGTGDVAEDAEFRRELDRVLAASGGGEVVVVDGAAHLSFTDAPRFLPPIPSVVGSLGRDGASRRAADVVRAFLRSVTNGVDEDGGRG